MNKLPSPYPTSRPTQIRYLVLGALCLAAAIAYVQRMCIGVAEQRIASDLELGNQAMGWVMGGFFITYALGQLPGGVLGHRWGTRQVLSLCMVLCSLTTGLAGLAGGFLGLWGSRLLMGAAQAGIFPCCTQTFTKWFPPTRRAVISGVLTSFMSVGGAVGVGLTGFLVEQVGWRWVMALFTLPGLAWAAWFFSWFHDDPADHESVNRAELELLQSTEIRQKGAARARRPEPIPWHALLSSGALACICSQQFFRAGGYQFYGTWFARYLKETRGVNLGQAGFLNSLPLWGVVAGSFLGGVLSDWILVRTGSRRLSRQGLAIVSMAACGLCFLAAYWIADVWLAVLVISAGSLFASLSAPCAYAITIDMGGKYVAPVFGLMNMSGNLGALAFPVVIGLLADALGTWEPLLLIVAGIYLIGAACWAPLNPEGTIVE